MSKATQQTDDNQIVDDEFPTQLIKRDNTLEVILAEVFGGAVSAELNNFDGDLKAPSFGDYGGGRGTGIYCDHLCITRIF